MWWRGLDRNKLSKQGSASEALIRVYGPEFTKETKSEETVVFTSNLIYKYTRIKSQYSKETFQQSRNVPEGTWGDDASIENESNGQELTHMYTYLWGGSWGESEGKGCMSRVLSKHVKMGGSSLSRGRILTRYEVEVGALRQTALKRRSWIYCQGKLAQWHETPNYPAFSQKGNKLDYRTKRSR